MEAEVTAAYGKVPVDEFDALRDAYAEKERLYVNPEDHNEFRTFREDYEFYGADEGVVHVRYGGQCTKCGTGTTINQDHEFWRKP